MLLICNAFLKYFPRICLCLWYYFILQCFNNILFKRSTARITHCTILYTMNKHFFGVSLFLEDSVFNLYISNTRQKYSFFAYNSNTLVYDLFKILLNINIFIRTILFFLNTQTNTCNKIQTKYNNFQCIAVMCCWTLGSQGYNFIYTYTHKCI